MNCTPESNVYLESCKSQHGYDCSDSGYSGLFHSPQQINGVDPCRSLSPVKYNETPKENLRLSGTPKERIREPFGSLGKDSRGTQRQSSVSWCETPKVYKRESSLRHRLLMCKPATDVKIDNAKSPCTRKTESSIRARSEHWLSVSFDSLEGALASSTLKSDHDLPLSGRKRRLLFTQVRTSTLLEDGKLNSGYPSSFERRVSLSDADFSESISASGQNNIETPRFIKSLAASSIENSQSPVSAVASNLNDSSSVLCTPSSTHSPKCIRSLCEDSGFSSLALDKSQDSFVDHDGSFQELLLSASRGNCETPNLAEAKRRSRLQRQQRLSTLKEGGSQSEEDPTEKKRVPLHQCHSHSKEDDVFGDGATPCSVFSAKYCNIRTSDSFSSAKLENATPLRQTTTRSENMTPLSTDLANPDVTPLRTTPVNLSLTPALQLVHAMCHYKAHMFFGQSPSLKEQLKSTAALVETPVMFRTTMPLAGLIGRKMGLRKVDILTELKKRNLRHILAVILTHLTSESIYMCGQVCKTWNKIIKQDKRASFKRRSHLSEVEAALELGGAAHVPDAETRLALLKRSALKTVQAQSRTSSYCTPQSGNSTLTPSQHNALNSGSSHKQDKFLEVAKTLFNDECLKPCPRCQHPARCHSVKGEGVCSRADCGFQFCTACLCAFHGSRECGSQSVGRRKKDILLPGSAQSKRNVRRL
ncbi:F-box only protein 43 [Etheostoma spectabile]|uniref:F-box only protein 43 n=1 Tax=Etheostoma spectabile TaxID=54343 RepID=UPI0013AF0C08|nr:F-box only protein 43 [Etheostoma spectabile]XP_032375132.1 F-box only protein 43 [Etheostoma spectabile]XP_032375133.1 F-box only protein 43 [Etheostoma spectabile]